MTAHEPLLLRAKTGADLFRGEKVASAISRMPDDEKKWPAHIYSELMREMPFLAQYDVEIVLDRTDPEAGAALGYAQVRNRTLSRPQDNISSPGNILRIPIIVQDRRLQKFYIFEAGKQTYPLTEERVQQAMLNPSVFDTDASRVPASASLIDQMYPPTQQRQGFGRVTEPAAMGLSKLSSAPEAEKEAGAARVSRLLESAAKKVPASTGESGSAWAARLKKMAPERHAALDRGAGKMLRRAEKHPGVYDSVRTPGRTEHSVDEVRTAARHLAAGTNAKTAEGVKEAISPPEVLARAAARPAAAPLANPERLAPTQLAQQHHQQAAAAAAAAEQKATAFAEARARFDAHVARNPSPIHHNTGMGMEAAYGGHWTAPAVASPAPAPAAPAVHAPPPAASQAPHAVVAPAAVHAPPPAPAGAAAGVAHAAAAPGATAAHAAAGAAPRVEQAAAGAARRFRLGGRGALVAGAGLLGAGALAHHFVGREKTAFVMGRSHPGPDYLSSAAIPYDQRQGTMLRYGRAKADEEPTRRWKAMLAGMGIGGGLGAGVGAGVGGGRGAIIGGAAGAALGAAGGHVARENDKHEIRRWKTAKKKGPDSEKKLADKRIRSAIEDDKDEERTHRRNMEMMMFSAATRPTETHHHHYSKDASATKEAINANGLARLRAAGGASNLLKKPAAEAAKDAPAALRSRLWGANVPVKPQPTAGT